MQFVNRTHRLARGLEAYWLSNEGSGDTVQDVSGNGHHGIFFGDAAWTAGDSGSAIYFPGTPYGDADNECINVPASTRFDSGAASGEITVLCSFRPDIADDNPLVAKWEYSTGDWAFIWDGDVGQKSLRLYIGPAFTVVVLDTANNADISLGAWHTAGFTKLGSDYAGYMDGVCVETENNALTWTDDRPLTIGAMYTDGNYAMNGAINWVMIFNRALSAGEMAYLTANPSCMFERPTPELWVGAGGEPPAGNPQFITIIMSRLPAWLAVGMIITVLAVAMGCDVNGVKRKAA